MTGVDRMPETSVPTGSGSSSTAQPDSAGDADPAPAAAAAAAGPAALGSWATLPFGSEVLAVHGALLPTGKVLFAAGSGNSDVRFHGPRFGDATARNWTSGVGAP